MRTVPRVMLAFVVARAVFGLLFLVSMVGQWKLPWYLPIERRWQWASAVEGVGMDWYGRSGVALVGGALAGLMAWALGGWSRVSPWLSRPAVVIGIARLGGTMLLYDIVFYTLSLLTREIHPIALPAWYCPR